jgi:hypothetical protein
MGYLVRTSSNTKILNGEIENLNLKKGVLNPFNITKILFAFITNLMARLTFLVSDNNPVFMCSFL